MNEAPREPRDLRKAALFVLLLWLSFYALSLAIIGALLWVPWAQIQYERRLGFAGIATAVAALWVGASLLPSWPKRERWPPPLPKDRHPGLHALIADLCARSGVAAPAEVYLVAEATAFAARRPRWLGLSSVSAVGVGLPLLAHLDRDALASVILHELGHHHAGDVRLGPWIYRTRQAIGKVVERLDGSAALLQLPFVLYGRFFMRVTRRSSQQQEFAADHFAATHYGAEATGRALSVVHRIGPMWELFWQSEAVPALEHGLRPPLLEGFRTFMSTELQPELKELYQKARNRPPSPLDTHPSLDERLGALNAARFSDPGQHQSLALVDSVEAAEHDALGFILVAQYRDQLTAASWQELGTKLWIPEWRKQLAPYEQVLSRVRPLTLCDVLAKPEPYVQALRGPLSILSPAAEQKRMHSLLGYWLLLWLHDRGWALSLDPGAEPSAFSASGERVVPRALVRQLATRELSDEDWRALCRHKGIDG